MKKIIGIVCAAFAIFAAVSCKSSPATQEQLNMAFENVYETYESSLILDGAKTHTVQAGDTLSLIAKRYYGSGKGYYFPVIMLASSDVVLDPDLIAPGMVLKVPDLDKNLSNPVSRSKMKSYFKEIAGVYKKKGTETALTVRAELLEIADSL